MMTLKGLGGRKFQVGPVLRLTHSTFISWESSHGTTHAPTKPEGKAAPSSSVKTGTPPQSAGNTPTGINCFALNESLDRAKKMVTIRDVDSIPVSFDESGTGTDSENVCCCASIIVY